MSEPVLYVGTVGEGLWRSTDGRERWERLRNGLLSECEVRSLAIDPADAGRIYAGTNEGVFISDNGGDRWSSVGPPLDDLVVWSLSISPRSPSTLLAGTRPARIYRSDDRGATWRRLVAHIEELSANPALRYNRVTLARFDPVDPDRVWAGVEIGGVLTSPDGGKTWESRCNGLSSLDIHGLAIVPGAVRRLVASTNNDLNVSVDEGRTWTPQQVGNQFEWPYCRGLVASPAQPTTLYVGNGDGPPGSAGAAWRSTDSGQTWHKLPLPGTLNSTVWDFATHPADPARIYAYTVSGQVFVSSDSGARWRKLSREFGEIRALSWAPA